MRKNFANVEGTVSWLFDRFEEFDAHETVEGTPVAELRTAFGKVCDKTNWKNPIDATIPVEDVPVTVKAIRFYVSCEPTVSEPVNGLVRITAAAYAGPSESESQ